MNQSKGRKQRLPWKRGPAAGKIAEGAPQILEDLTVCPRRFFSLRNAAGLLRVSTQPLRDWLRQGYLRRDGPRHQFSKDELRRLVKWFEERAERFDWSGHTERLRVGRERRVYPFSKLERAKFSWPKDRHALTPREISRLVGCHPSLVVKAITSGGLRGSNRTRCRWEIKRRDWNKRFPFTAA